MPPPDPLAARLKRSIVDILRLEDVKPEDLKDEDPLIGSGLALDSVDMLELVMKIEKDYGIVHWQKVSVKCPRWCHPGISCPGSAWARTVPEALPPDLADRLPTPEQILAEFVPGERPSAQTLDSAESLDEEDSDGGAAAPERP